MNPYIYNSFKSDMCEASRIFICNTDYYIKRITSSSFVLTNNRKDIVFDLDGVNMVSSLIDIEHNETLGIYELFMKENIMYKYPIDKDMNMERKDWYKFLVKGLLDILMHDLKKYIT